MEKLKFIEAGNLANRAQILKQTKTIEKNKRKKAMIIIHIASILTLMIGAGFAQLPGSDASVIVPIQIMMVIALSSIFNKTIAQALAKGVIMKTTVTMIGRMVSEFLIGWIPIAGNILNALTAFTITQMVGWIIANEFAQK